MPAAAVIPASVASIKVAAVKRLAVETQCRAQVRWTLERENKSTRESLCVFFANTYRVISRTLSLNISSRLFPSVNSLLARVHIGIWYFFVKECCGVSRLERETISES